MERQENQRVMLTRRLLKESLMHLLSRENIYKISVRELCEGAGINRSTFYKYYGSPFDLLREMETDLLEMIEQALDAGGGEKKQTLTSVFTYLERNLELCRLLINNNVDPEFPSRLFGMPVIQREINKALMQTYSAQEMKYASCFLVYGSYHLIRQWINAQVHEPPEQIAAILMSLLNGTL